MLLSKNKIVLNSELNVIKAIYVFNIRKDFLNFQWLWENLHENFCDRVHFSKFKGWLY